MPRIDPWKIHAAGVDHTNVESVAREQSIRARKRIQVAHQEQGVSLRSDLERYGHDSNIPIAATSTDIRQMGGALYVETNPHQQQNDGVSQADIMGRPMFVDPLLLKPAMAQSSRDAFL